jgi:excisionase family DNA binding protein
MAHDRFRRNLTTGEIAELCGVNFRTVIRWIQRGHLKAFQLPGRGDNRVPIDDFIEFLRANDMPLPPDLRGEVRSVLLIGFADDERASADEVLRADGLEVIEAASEFEAGLESGRGVPTAAIIATAAFATDGIDRMVDGFGRLGSGVILCGDPEGVFPSWVVGLEVPVDWSVVPAVIDDIAKPPA